MLRPITTLKTSPSATAAKPTHRMKDLVRACDACSRSAASRAPSLAPSMMRLAAGIICWVSRSMILRCGRSVSALVDQTRNASA
jgi:hypothetical protein